MYPSMQGIDFNWPVIFRVSENENGVSENKNFYKPDFLFHFHLEQNLIHFFHFQWEGKSLQSRRPTYFQRFLLLFQPLQEFHHFGGYSFGFEWSHPKKNVIFHPKIPPNPLISP